MKEEQDSIILYKSKKEWQPTDVLRTIESIQRNNKSDQEQLEFMYENIMDDIDEDIRKDILQGISGLNENDYYDLEEDNDEEEDDDEEEGEEDEEEENEEEIDEENYGKYMGQEEYDKEPIKSKTPWASRKNDYSEPGEFLAEKSLLPKSLTEKTGKKQSNQEEDWMTEEELDVNEEDFDD